MKNKFSSICLIIVAVFFFYACVPNSPQTIRNKNNTLASDRPQLKKGVVLIDKTFNLILENYVDPIPTYDLIIAFAKGIENTVGTTDLLYRSADSYVVISPVTKRPIPDRRSKEEALKAILNIYDFYARKEKDKEPLNLAYEAAQSMVSSLDPHSAMLSPDAMNELRAANEGTFSGIGIHITMQDDFVTVVSPIEGTPAYNAGIKAKDKITKVDGVETKEIRDAVKRMRGLKGTPVTVTILREAEPEPIEFRLVRDTIPLVSIKAISIKPGYGYVRITNFRKQTTNNLVTALEKMASETLPLEGLILDLRNNPGGLLSQAIGVSDVFLEEGTLLRIKGRLEKHTKTFRATRNYIKREYPIVVLINDGTASGSEIVAGAVQDHDRALIIGTPSFGKGSVQTIETLDNGYGVKFTIARYYTPKGRAIQAQGIEPDVTVQNKESDFLKTIQEDYQVKNALRILEHTKSGSIADLMASARKNLSMEKEPAVIHTPSKITIASTSKRNPDAIAVVIGNKNYSHTDIPAVKFAVNDATAIKEYLIETLGYKDGNIIFETDTSKANLEMIFGTQNNHRGMLYNYIKPQKSDVFIYYSGHGAPDPTTNKAYLVPIDCNPVMMDLTAYPLDILYNNLPKIEAKRMTVVIDACFSGGTNTGKWLVPNASPALIKVKNPITALNNITIFTSAENNQVSSWYPEKQHSMFTYFFLRAISGDADFNQDNRITYKEIYDYVADRTEGVPYFAKRLHGGRMQNPTLQSSNNDAVFVKF